MLIPRVIISKDFQGIVFSLNLSQNKNAEMARAEAPMVRAIPEEHATREPLT